jgi:hypothetical protein
VVAVLYTDADEDSGLPVWWLVSTWRPDEARPLARWSPFWSAGMSEAELLAGAAGVVEGLIGGREP